MSKGQSALEYLTTFGWALLVLVIVLSALFTLGVLNPSTYQGSACTGFSKLAYQAHSFHDDNFQLRLLNNSGASITSAEATILDGDDFSACDANSVASWAASQAKTFTITCTNTPDPSAPYTASILVTFEGRDLNQVERASCTGTAG